MSRLVLSLSALALVAACALPPGGAVPERADLSRDRVVVTLSDGSRCIGDRATAEVTASGWQGRLTGCDQALPYAVTLDARQNPVQWLLGQVFAVLGLDGALAPNGRVAVTDGRGRTYLFTSPRQDKPGH